jgi:Zn-dependent M16 (insulinase) family peptidase
MMSAARAALTTNASRVCPPSRTRNLVRAHDSAKRGMPRRPLLLGGVAGVTARLGSGFAANAVEAAPEKSAGKEDAAPALSPAVAAVASLVPGQKLAGGAFEVVSVEEVPEYSVACAELLHLKTGARWMHCGADDPNNVFNVAFRTTPTDDTGVAHILEHTALCGSEKYPIRDPFFNMLRRSLSTFMNAMTAADYTCYPFATMNSADYFNLLGVYLDAAFFPKLSYEDFLQEGHRLEFEKQADATSELALKGVVFNEMKGAMGSQSARFSRALSAALFPTSTYHHNSGGDPVSIPSLTHDDLKRFHASHYHPSNARFFTYGDLPLEATLEKSQTLALSRFEKIDVSGLEVADETRLTAPISVSVPVPTDAVVADANKQTTVSRAYLQVNQIKEQNADLENFALVVASDLLLSGPQAYFHESLLESGLGSGFAPGTGYSSTRRETSFAVGLKGVAAEDVPEVERRIDATLAAIAKEGFPRERVEAVMHQVELGAARVTTSFGLGVAFGAMGTWVHGGDGLRPLRTPRMAAALNAALDADERFWQKLFARRFVENPHAVTVVGVPDAEYDAKLEAEEKKAVKAIAEALSEKEKEKIVNEAVALRESQDATQDVSVLPTLVVADAVPRAVKKWGSVLDATAGAGGKPLQIDAQPTNGLTYVNVLFDLTDLPDRLAPYVDLFADYVTELGTAARDYKELAQYEKLKTGGIGAGVDAKMSLDGSGATEVYVSFSGHCLDRNVSETLGLMAEIATSAKWRGESERVALLLSRRAASAGASVAQQGMQYAKALAASTIAAESALDYRTSGLPHVAMLQRLVKDKDAGVKEVEDALAEIAAFALTRENVARCRVACVPGAVSDARASLDAFLEALPSRSRETTSSETTVGDALRAFAPSPGLKAFVSVPQQTNYCAASYATVPYAHPDAAPLYLLGHALSSAYLHREVREKGGAYGGGASAAPVEGVFAMSSYRDPNTLSTIETFASAAAWAARDGNLTAEILEEAHLKAFKAIDAPLAPSSRGASLFTGGMDDASRQTFRDRLLDCTVEQMRACAEKYLVGQTPALAIVGAPANAEAMREAGYDILDAQGNAI